MTDKPDIEIILPDAEPERGGFNHSSHRPGSDWQQSSSGRFSSNLFGGPAGKVWSYGFDDALLRKKKKRGPIAAIGNVIATVFGAFAVLTLGTIFSIFMLFALLLGGTGKSKPGFQIKRR